MEQRENFRRMSIEEMEQAKQKEQARKAMEDHFSEQVFQRAEELSQKLVDEGMDPDSFEIMIESNFQDDKLVVNFVVAQLAGQLTFNPPN